MKNAPNKHKVPALKPNNLQANTNPVTVTTSPTLPKIPDGNKKTSAINNNTPKNKMAKTISGVIYWFLISNTN